ncbi:uncharacterized protein LOC134206989 [Armigeres subalbatus]|uniref:uncharacterized protein LOC134206989 n=1 Tax=Armigeres subalbatus TaxID=124917 RepID=UPI002ED381DE
MHMSVTAFRPHQPWPQLSLPPLPAQPQSPGPAWPWGAPPQPRSAWVQPLAQPGLQPQLKARPSPAQPTACPPLSPPSPAQPPLKVQPQPPAQPASAWLSLAPAPAPALGPHQLSPPARSAQPAPAPKLSPAPSAPGQPHSAPSSSHQCLSLRLLSALLSPSPALPQSLGSAPTKACSAPLQNHTGVPQPSPAPGSPACLPRCSQPGLSLLKARPCAWAPASASLSLLSSSPPSLLCPSPGPSLLKPAQSSAQLTSLGFKACLLVSALLSSSKPASSCLLRLSLLKVASALSARLNA